MRRAEPGPSISAPRSIAPPAVVWTDDEWATIARGHIAQEMEDKWDVFADGDRVRFQRSWTGLGVYECRFERCEGGWRMAEAVVCGDNSLYKASPTDEGEAIRLESLIRGVVLYEA
jgi:hypothetical protein